MTTRFVVATTENAKRPFCIFDRFFKTYVRDSAGLIMSYKTFHEAQQALFVTDGPTNGQPK
jgi:hypothetical protein